MIYFIQAGKDGPIKIGYSKVGAKSRLATLQTSNYSNLSLLKTIKGDLKYEQRLHLMFEDSKIRGEWFKPTAALLNFIEQGNNKVVMEIYRDWTLLAKDDVSMFTEKQITEIIKIREEYGLTCYVFKKRVKL